jgi:hypothetical protein
MVRAYCGSSKMREDRNQLDRVFSPEKRSSTSSFVRSKSSPLPKLL